MYLFFLLLFVSSIMLFLPFVIVVIIEDDGRTATPDPSNAKKIFQNQKNKRNDYG